MRILRVTVSEWSLRAAGPRLAFVAVAGLIAVFPAFEAGRIATAVTLGSSMNSADLRRALALDPGNADLEHRLGLARFYSDSSPDRENGIDHLRRATMLNPREALYWSDLSAACEALHDASCADSAAASALDASPMTPRLYWSAANQDLRAGRQAEAFPLFRRLLEFDPSYADAVFQVCWRTAGTPAAIDEGILAGTRNPNVSLAFVNLVSSRGDYDSAYFEWRRFATAASSAPYAESAGPWRGAAAAPLTVAEVEPYLDRLIDAGRQRDVIAVWDDLVRLRVISPPDSMRRRGAAFNGGFEQTPLNAGFDWRYNPQPFVAATISDIAHTGSHSLRVEFTGGRNQEYEPVLEVVPVEPGRPYALSAYVRSQAITSDTGPRLRVRNLTCQPASCLDVASPGVTSTTDWHAITLTFATGPETRFVRLSIWRPRSRGYPSEISGVLWIDDVSMIEQPLEASVSTTAESDR